MIRQQPTTDVERARINIVFNDLEPLMVNLMARWNDEKEYEDIADYGEVIRKRLPEGFELTGMQKRPFGFKFKVDGKHYKMEITGRQYTWRAKL